MDTFGTARVNLTDGQIARKLEKIFDMRPYAIENRFKLRSPIYAETAAYGHMGRKPRTIQKTFEDGSGKKKKLKVKLFPWEELDFVSRIKKEFKL